MSEKDNLLVNPEVQSLIQHMVDSGEYVITPRLDTKGIFYPAMTKVFPNKSESEFAGFLTRLTNVHLLNAKLLDKVIVCPTCGSPSVSSKYNCPRCSSFDIGKASIIEHIRCGFIGSKERFVSGNQLVCPKCRNTISEMDYRKIGTSFECNSCSSRFESPKMSHKCNSCEDVFTYKEARYDPIYQYELSEEAKKTIVRGTAPLASTVASLKEKGFEVGLKQDIVGKSGATHNFDIVARKGSMLVVANFTFEPKEEDIIGLFAKKYDVDPSFTLLISLSPPSKEEEAVSKAYGVKILSSVAGHSVADQIVALASSEEHKTVEAQEKVQPEPERTAKTMEEEEVESEETEQLPLWNDIEDIAGMDLT
jgi:predicted amidophosphoribosyltransferase